MFRLKNLLLIIVLIISSLATSGYSADYYVDVKNGSNSSGVGSSVNPWKTISHAMLLVQGTSGNHANLHIAEGIYNVDSGEEFPLVLKNYLILTGSGIDITIIDAFGSGKSVIFCEEIQGIKIQNMTISGGGGDKFLQGGGIHLWQASMEIIECALQNNIADEGGGIYCDDSTLKIIGCQLRNNRASFGGGIRCYNSSPEITSCLFERNWVESFNWYGGDGGGILFDNSSAQINDCQFINNRAANGGGILCYSSSLVINNSIFKLNHVEIDDQGGFGGAIFSDGDPAPTILNCEFSENNGVYGGGIFCSGSEPGSFFMENCVIIANKASGGPGGGFHCYASTPLISNCLIENNISELVGEEGGSGGGISMDSASPLLTGCLIKGNRAVWGAGIGCYYSNPVIEHTIIMENTALTTLENDGHGGGIHCDQSELTIRDCLIASNTATEGGAIFSYTSYPYISNVTITGNTADEVDGIYSLAGSNPEITNSIIWDDNIIGEAIVINSDVHGGFEGDGNFSSVPLFVQGPFGDYYLSQKAAGQAEDSPCINKGNDTAQSLELDTRTTRTDKMPDSGIVDLGFHYPIAVGPTPTPTYSTSPSLTKTISQTPTKTFTQTPSPTDSTTPTSSFTPTPTYTPTPSDNDYVEPIVNIVSHKEGDEVSGTVTIQILATDASGIKSVEVQFDYGQWVSCYQSANYWQYQWDTSNYSDGSKVMCRARATDKSSNQNVGYSSMINLTIKSIQNEYWVDSTASDNSGDGSRYSPWKTISHALSQVDGTEDSPVIIRVLAGSYSVSTGETFPIILESNVSLQSNYKQNTIIDATGSYTSALMLLSCKNVLIKSFIITGGKGFLVDPLKIRIGGGIACVNSSPTIMDCDITGNSADWGGGVLCYGSSPEIVTCEIKNNSAKIGAGILCIDSSPVIIDTTIENNSYDGSDAATSFAANYFTSLRGMKIGLDMLAEIDFNTLNGNGGGIFCYMSDPSISNCQIKNNKALNGGGISGISSTLIKIENSSIENNSATKEGGIGGDGGGLYFFDTDAEISDSTIIGNDATNGGGINLISESALTLSRCDITDNSGTYGGGIYSNASSSNITDSKLNKNSGMNGGGIYGSASSSEITGSDIKENMSNGGGGIYCLNKSELTLNDCELSDNRAYQDGGGGLYCLDTKLEISNSNFTENQALKGVASGGSGGGIFMGANTSPKVGETKFTGNLSYWQGGGIYFGENSKPELTSCEIKFNEAIYGGGVFVSSNAEPNMTDCVIKSNKAKQEETRAENQAAAGGYGGGIFFSGASGNMADSLIELNNANMGGGLFFYGSSANMMSCIVRENAAESSMGVGGDGGGIFCTENSEPDFINCLVASNTAGEAQQYRKEQSAENSRGGGIYSNNSRPKITNSTIADNIASQTGGIFSEGNGIPTLVNCIGWDNGSYPITTGIDITFSDIEGGFAGEGNINIDPEFIDISNENQYYLSQIGAGQGKNSPCVNAGSIAQLEGYTPNWMTTRTDGVTDTGKVDIGYHHPTPLVFDLYIKPEYWAFEDGDTFKLLVDLDTTHETLMVDIYLVMIDPTQKLWFGSNWDTQFSSLVSGVMLPSDLSYKGGTLLQITVPSTKPPINISGSYIFAIAATKTSASDFVSNLATANFLIK